MASASKKKRRKRRARAKSATAGPVPAAPQALSSSEGSGSDPSPAPKSRRENPTRLRAEADERPPAPWGTFPLVEIVVLVGIVMLIVGAVIGFSEPRGQALLGTGLVLASLAGLELSVREHFAGYRSHTSLLTAAAGVAAMLGLYYLVKASASVAMAGGAAIAAIAALLLVRAFQARSGGRSVKLR